MDRTSLPRRLARSRLAVVATVILGAASVAAEAPSVAPLEEPQLLFAPTGGFGQTSADVAVKPDGGMIAVWRDTNNGDVLGRWFGPPEEQGGSAGAIFFLREAGAAPNFAPLLVPRVARGDDGYLAVWLDPVLPNLVLFARAFDGEGRPRSAVRKLAVSSLPFDLAARPGGGFAVAFESGEAGGGVRLLLLGPTGAPLGASLPVTEEVTAGSSVPLHLAVDPDGAIAITWSRPRSALSTSGVRARTFSATGQPHGPAFDVVAGEKTASGVAHDLAAVGQEHFLLVWAGNALTEAKPPRTVYVRSFDAEGHVAPSSPIDPGGSPDLAASLPAVAAGPDGQGVVAWVEEGLEAPRPVARLVLPWGLPRGPVFDLDDPLAEGELVNGLHVDRGGDGNLAFGWGTGVMIPFLPIPADAFRDSQVRRFRAESECYPLDQLAVRTLPAAPTADVPVTLVFDAVGECDEVSVVGAAPEADPIRVDLAVLHGICDPPEVFETSTEVPVGLLSPGRHAVALDVSFEDLPACSRQYTFTVGEAPPPPHPDVPPLTSSELPGFRIWVEIGGGAAGPVFGAQEPACVAETLCVSGRVPGRSEVFVRIPGPKPNGLLWPTLVKLTTSEVEVWIEQASTGALRYYRLEGARPGFDELPGLFDRHGFEP